MNRNRPPEGLTPQESRYVDGEMSAQEARSMEHRLAADPARADRVAAWRDTMDLWRNDAQRAATTVASDPDALVDRILADRSVSNGLADRGPRRISPHVARWYAAAAVLLMAVGVTGTWMAQTPRAPAPSTRPQVADIQDLFLELMADASDFAPRLTEGR